MCVVQSWSAIQCSYCTIVFYTIRHCRAYTRMAPHNGGAATSRPRWRRADRAVAPAYCRSTPGTVSEARWHGPRRHIDCKFSTRLMLGPRPVSAFRDPPLCCRRSPEGTPAAAGAALECGLARFFGPRFSAKCLRICRVIRAGLNNAERQHPCHQMVTSLEAGLMESYHILLEPPRALAG